MIKKGVSNFIGAVLLIAIVVAVSMFVGNWYINITKKNTREVGNQLDTAITCNDVSLNYRDATFNESGNGYLRFYLENVGSRDVTITLIRVTATNGSYQDFNDTYIIDAGNERLIALQLNTANIKEVDSVRIIPKDCASKAISIEGAYITSYP